MLVRPLSQEFESSEGRGEVMKLAAGVPSDHLRL